MLIGDFFLPDDLYYTRDHAWCRFEGEVVRVGVTDFMQKLAGEFTFIRLPRPGKQLQPGATLFSLQSGKWSGKVAVPFPCTVVEANKELLDLPSLMNSDPYGKGWVAVLRPDDPEAAKRALLYGEEQVRPWLEGEIAQHVK